MRCAFRVWKELRSSWLTQADVSDARHEADERLKDGMTEGDEHLKRVMAESDERLMHAMVELAEAQKRTQESIAHTDKNLAALIDIVVQQQNGHSNN
jgi:hypothetical protein